ncbi:MAG: hypothetical protein QM760_21580 [Nibricoccus sp.]
MKTKSARLLACLLLPSLITVTLSAAENEKTVLSAGAAAGSLETRIGDADLAGGTGTVQLHLGELMLFDASLRGSYTYLKSTDSTNIERQYADIDLIFSASALGICTPYGMVGARYDKFDALAYSGNADDQTGLGLGAGVEIAVLPGLLSITPYGRYVTAEKLETLTYGLDAQLHFTVLSAGLNVTYEDNLSREGNLTTVTAYVGLRF